MSNKNKTNESLTAKIEEFASGFSDEQMASILEQAAETFDEKVKELKEDEDFKKLKGKDKEQALTELRIDVLTEMLVNKYDQHRTFVHWNRAGYWMDKLIGGAITVGVGVTAVAVAAKFAGKKEEAPVEAFEELPNGASNPFQTTATERPIAPSRSLKAS